MEGDTRVNTFVPQCSQISIRKSANDVDQIPLAPEKVTLAVRSPVQKDQVNSFMCNVCEKVFNSIGDLRKHSYSHRCIIRPHSCDICHKAFTRKSQLRNHSFVHEGIKPHSCHQCGKAFSSRSSLQRHSLTHKSLSPHACNVCGKTFRREDNLQKHLLIHKGIKPHLCRVCGIGFTQKSHLITHSLIHEGLKAYSCGICSKTFRREDNLQKHSLIHEGLKPHMCGVCGKTFRRTDTLQKHYVIHQDLKAYSCHVCNKAFKREESLERHSFIHKGLKRLECAICGKVFVKKKALELHLLIHKGIRPYRCDVCGSGYFKRRSLVRHSAVHGNRSAGESNEFDINFVSTEVTNRSSGRVRQDLKYKECGENLEKKDIWSDRTTLLGHEPWSWKEHVERLDNIGLLNKYVTEYNPCRMANVDPLQIEVTNKQCVEIYLNVKEENHCDTNSHFKVKEEEDCIEILEEECNVANNGTGCVTEHPIDDIVKEEHDIDDNVGI